jgi:ubiquinone/menaquinone biosynthesis C-methylase UbiE
MCGGLPVSRAQLNYPPPPAAHVAVLIKLCCRREEGLDAQWFVTLFGGKAVYIVGAILAVITVLIIWAFRQGRAVEFWPPKVGSRPDRVAAVPPGRPAADAPNNQLKIPLGAPVVETAREFDVREAARFYREIAQNYDQRNSAKLLATHMEVITRIDHARKAKPTLRVLDLGGGTGQNVATYFFNDRQIRWTYVDYCPAMIDQLQQHLAERRLYERLSVHLEDINRVHTRLPAKSHDVVLLNLVLSSMPQLPDFTRIATLLAPGGSLIVADINPAYTSAHPYYKATAADGTLVALRTHQVQPLEVARRAKEARLQLSEMTEIGPDAPSYSFIITFVNPAPPDDDHPLRETDAGAVPENARRIPARTRVPPRAGPG